MSRSGTLLVLILIAAIAIGGCASNTGFVPQPFPVPRHFPTAPVGVAAPAGAISADGYAIVGTALQLRGSPYRNGGSDPTGFDCSGFIWYVFAQHGISMPRTVAEQFRIGNSVSADALEPGDLVFFRTAGRETTHVGMMIGGDEFVHAPSSQGSVRVERLGSSYWAPRFTGARRVR